MLCSDTKTFTQRLVHFSRTNLGCPLPIPHFSLDLGAVSQKESLIAVTNSLNKHVTTT